MKKFACIVLMILLLASLAACRMGGNDETTAPTTAPTTTPTTAPTTAPTTVPTMPTILPTIDPTIDTNIPDPEVDPNSTDPIGTDGNRMMPGMGR